MQGKLSRDRMGKEDILLVIGASAGGSTALPEVIRQLPLEQNLIVMVVMHLSKASIGDLLVNRLQKFTSFRCQMASNGETLAARHIYVARPDYHLMVNDGKMLVGRGAMENRYRPSIDALFRSAAVAFAPKVIGVILTGMLEDGAAGMCAIKRSGGICIIQHPDDAKYADMPRAVLSVIDPHYAVALTDIGDAIRESIGAVKTKRKKKIPADVLQEAQIAERVNIGMGQLEELGDLSAISCPDCGGSLWELKNSGVRSFRCHVGHAFSEEGLIKSMEVTVESTLWTALRMMEERKNLYHQIAARESRKGKTKLAAAYLDRSKEMAAHARKLKEILLAGNGRS